MVNKYYQDELAYLRELGREFALAYPEAAPFLAERGSDPDVERLLEGFAFLSGRIRQKLEDEFPELTHTLLDLLWPHYLRPIPAASIVQFEPLPQVAKETRPIPRGTELASAPLDGTACRFQTVYDVTLLPIAQEGVELRTEAPPQLRLRFRLAEGVTLKQASLTRLRLCLVGEPPVTRALYLCLTHLLKRVLLKTPTEGSTARAIALGPDVVRPIGFAPEESLIPTPPASFEGYRLLLEYFAFPAKFQFVDVTGLGRLPELGEIRSFDLVFEMSRLPEQMPALGTAGILLNCTPVINVFPNDGDPIRLDPKRTEYRIRPSGTNPSHYEVYSVDKVTGYVRGSGQAVAFRPFLGFTHAAAAKGEAAAFYHARRVPSEVAEGSETYLSVIGATADGTPGSIETVSIGLTCTNRDLPTRLRIGDLNASTPTSPTFAKFKNITRVTPGIPPPIDGDILWHLVSHLALNFRTLASVESLRQAVGLYNFRARVDRQAEQSHRKLLEGIQSVSIRPETRLLRGTPVRGLAVELGLEEDHFAGEGDMVLFATLLNEFFALGVTINAFSRLTIKGLKFGGVYEWPPRIGRRIIL